MGTFFIVSFFFGGLWFVIKVASMKSDTRHIKETRYEKAKRRNQEFVEKKQIEEFKKDIENKIIDVEIVELSKPKKQKSWKQLGDEYEAQVAYYYKSLGYEVIERGKTLGRKDGGIDLIAKKENQKILIQCKNRNSIIKQKDIKQFLFDTDKFINENNIEEEIELLYVIANDVLDKGAKWTLNNERENLNFKVIPYLEG